MPQRYIRLINTRTLRFKDFFFPPSYAILSHTWSDGEVSFRDMTSNPKVENMKGYKKIRLACTQAVKDGLEFLWCDTCSKISGGPMFSDVLCLTFFEGIDKSSSAELSEAINAVSNYLQLVTKERTC